MVIQRWAEVGLFRQAGRVAHALAGALRSLAQDWALMVTQLEHQMLTGNLTLQVMACHMHNVHMCVTQLPLPPTSATLRKRIPVYVCCTLPPCMHLQCRLRLHGTATTTGPAVSCSVLM